MNLHSGRFLGAGRIGGLAMLVFLAVASLLLLPGCPTPYAPGSPIGGYSDRYMGNNVYEVHFSGNGYTPRDRVERGLLLRCAEIALRQGYPYFEMMYGGTDRSHSMYYQPATASSYGWFYSVTKYDSSATIRLRCDRYGSGYVMDAQSVASENAVAMQSSTNTTFALAAECRKSQSTSGQGAQGSNYGQHASVQDSRANDCHAACRRTAESCASGCHSAGPSARAMSTDACLQDCRSELIVCDGRCR